MNEYEASNSAGRKDDTTKNHPSYILSDMHAGVAGVIDVAEFGARKYAARGWKTVPNAIERYSEALLRHTLAYAAGELIDTDSKLPHLAHIAWNAMALQQLRLDCVQPPQLGQVVAVTEEQALQHTNLARYNK